MRCRAVQRRLDRLRLGNLRPRVYERVQSHLEGCVACQQELARHERLQTLLLGLPAPPSPPAGFQDRLLAAAAVRVAAPAATLASATRQRWRLPSGRSPGAQMAQVAALAAGLLVGVLMAQQTWRSVHSQTPHPQTTQSSAQFSALRAEEFDYLVDTPGESLAEDYFLLTASVGRHGA